MKQTTQEAKQDMTQEGSDIKTKQETTQQKPKVMTAPINKINYYYYFWKVMFHKPTKNQQRTNGEPTKNQRRINNATYWSFYMSTYTTV